MAETTLEHWARVEVAKAGGLMLKWVSPGTTGIPDDLIFWPCRRVDIVEYKFEDEGDLSPRQMIVRDQLNVLGWAVIVLRTRAAVLEYIDSNRPIA